MAAGRGFPGLPECQCQWSCCAPCAPVGPSSPILGTPDTPIPDPDCRYSLMLPASIPDSAQLAAGHSGCGGGLGSQSARPEAEPRTTNHQQRNAGAGRRVGAPRAPPARRPKNPVQSPSASAAGEPPLWGVFLFTIQWFGIILDSRGFFFRTAVPHAAASRDAVDDRVLGYTHHSGDRNVGACMPSREYFPSLLRRRSSKPVTTRTLGRTCRAMTSCRL